MSDWKVKIEYKNEKLETVVEKEYDFVQYTELLQMELKRVIMDVEDAFYAFSGNKQKEDWDDDMKERFKRIRHKLLDQANAVKRLPQNLYHNGQTAYYMPSGEYIAHILSNQE